MQEEAHFAAIEEEKYLREQEMREADRLAYERDMHNGFHMNEMPHRINYSDHDRVHV